MTKIAEKTVTSPKLLLIGIQAPYNKTENIQAYYDEFIALVKSNNIAYVDAAFIKLRAIEPSTFITSGHVADLAERCKKEGIEEVLLSESISAQQEHNLSDILGVKVFDRTQLILEIFEKAAVSAEGKKQVAIAMFEHQKSRLAGKGKGMAQQRGILGMRGGFGETMKEKERRHIDDRIAILKRELLELARIRETQRKRRLKSQLPLICLVGYTNAGKSTILNTLTHAQTLAIDKLFATLDTTTRELYIAGKKRGLISDTVGFIQLLPPQLIEAFKSTLTELQYATLLLHVIDLSNSQWEQHINVVHHILADLGVEAPMLYVFNKIDRVSITPHIQRQLDQYQPHVLINATNREHMTQLISYLDTYFAKEVPKEEEQQS